MFKASYSLTFKYHKWNSTPVLVSFPNFCRGKPILWFYHQGLPWSVNFSNAEHFWMNTPWLWMITLCIDSLMWFWLLTVWRLINNRKHTFIKTLGKTSKHDRKEEYHQILRKKFVYWLYSWFSTTWLLTHCNSLVTHSIMTNCLGNITVLFQVN